MPEYHPAALQHHHEWQPMWRPIRCQPELVLVGAGAMVLVASKAAAGALPSTTVSRRLQNSHCLRHMRIHRMVQQMPAVQLPVYLQVQQLLARYRLAKIAEPPSRLYGDEMMPVTSYVMLVVSNYGGICSDRFLRGMTDMLVKDSTTNFMAHIARLR